MTYRLSDDDRIDWLTLARTPRIGPITFHQLLKKFGSPKAALRALPGLNKRSAPLVPPQRSAIEIEIERARAFGAQLVASCEQDFPPLLAALDPPPPILTKKGKLSLTQKPTIAIVGARNASAAGLKIARDIAAVLGAADYTIVSGLARGIDAAAHSGSLTSGTVAVLAGGVDHAYPPQNIGLYESIAASGLLVSESPLGHRALARDFPRRNRLITGLANGVVVIEAAERSGSLISARLAGEQGREVMAVPGSPLDPRSSGTNHLIRQGAILVRSAEDVIDAMRFNSQAGMSAPSTLFDNPDEPVGDLSSKEIQQVLNALSPVPMPLDDIARAARLNVSRTSAALMELELDGRAATFAGGAASLSP